MFGFFKKKNEVRDNVLKEFDQMIAISRIAPLSKQARVGKGIVDAENTFKSMYTVDSFQRAEFSERKGFIDILAKRQDELRVSDGDVSIEHIGYSLYSRWVLAVAMQDDKLASHFEEAMVYFRRAATTL